MHNNKIIDCHVHFGKFKDVEYSSEALVNVMREMGVSKWCGMPVFTDDPFILPVLLYEYKKLLALAPNEFLPILGIDPNMIGVLPNLTEFEDIPYVAIKIHPYIHHWLPGSEKFNKVLSHVRKKKVPLMIHTGGRALCDAGTFYRICKQNPDINFILCHGRPVSEILSIILDFPIAKNIFIDIAFMTIEEIKILISEKLSDRIIFGSDFPINEVYYPDIESKVWYNNRIEELTGNFGSEIFDTFNSNYTTAFYSMNTKTVSQIIPKINKIEYRDDALSIFQYVNNSNPNTILFEGIDIKKAEKLLINNFNILPENIIRHEKWDYIENKTEPEYIIFAITNDILIQLSNEFDFYVEKTGTTHAKILYSTNANIALIERAKTILSTISKK